MKNIFRIAANIFLFFLLLFSTFYIILQLPVVQNAAATKVTSTLSRELNTTVSLDRLSIEFFDKLVLENFYVEDAAGDTLLFSKELKANVRTDIIALLKRKLVIEEITLNQAEFNLRRDSGDMRNNLGFIQDYFANSDTTVISDNPKAPFHLDIEAIYLNDVHFTNSSIYKGEDLDIHSGNIEIQVEELNLPAGRLDIESIAISNPIVRITQYDWLEEIAPTIEAERSDFTATVNRLDLGSGQLIIDNLRRSPQKLTDDNTLDLNHLRVIDADISIENFKYHDWTFTGKIAGVSAKDKSGFVLDNLKAEDVRITERRAQFNNIELLTPNSTLGDTLIFKYRKFPDWREFPDRVLMDIKFDKKSKVRVGDIMSFAPALENNAFFVQNREEIVKIDGRISGKISNLKGRDLEITLADNTYLQGNFNTRNLNVKDEQYLDLRLERLVTDFSTVRQIIPNFNPPANFDKLGHLDFKGEFNGFFVDFVAFGELQTDLGRGNLDMRMNLKEGRKKARYSGSISLTDFDLATWTGNKDFGNVTFVSEVENGIGLTGETIQADLTAAIQNFTFRDYTYDNLNVKGNIKERFFNGDFKINDENVVFDFKGKVDFTRPKPLFDFNAHIDKLSLKPLNLAKRDLVISGKINQLYLEDTKLANIKGSAALSDFVVIENAIDTFALDTIYIVSEIEENNKRFAVDSDIMHAELAGTFDLSRLPQTFISFFDKNFHPFTQRLNIRPDTTKQIQAQQFTFDIDIFDSKDFNRLINPGLGKLANIRADGYFDNVRDSLEWDISVPVLQFNNITALEINTYGETTGNGGDLNFEIFETQIGPKIKIPPFKLLSIAEQDTVQFALNLISNSEFLDNINLDGKIYPYEDLIELSLNNSALVFLSDIWTIGENNYLRAGAGRVEAGNFKISSEGREIELYTVGKKGLEINARNFDLSFINEIWQDKRFQFAGPFRLNVQSQNIFELEDLSTFIVADTFIINGDDWGMLRIDGSTKSIKDKVNINLNMAEPVTGKQLAVEGYYNPPGLAVPQDRIPLDSKSPNYLNLDFNLSYFPVEFLGYLIQNGITDPQGYLDAQFKMHGPVKKLVLDGDAMVHDLGVTIDYLQTRYYADKQKLRLSENSLDATGGFITDKLGNKAYVTGGLKHDYLRNWGPEVNVKSDRFLMLETKEEDNELFYGTGIGSGDITFSGTFRSTNMDIKAVTGPGTEVSIPISYDQDASAVDFIKFKDKRKIVSFKDKDKITGSQSSSLIEGIDVTMNLELTPDAQMRMIFDEAAGDVIQGIGRGNIRMEIPRGRNEFLMYGHYEIDQGDYLFTMQNIVNKPFEVEPGGTIDWTGDPFGAEIDLVARYKNLTVPPYNFIQEYVISSTADVQTLARQATQVDLQMILTGELLKPEISFNIEFPNLRGPIRTFTDSKMRVIARDPNELNRQVFGLIVAGQFLPTSPSLQNEGLAIGINTLTEMLSQQLSIYLTELVTGWLAEDGLISGIDFDIAYNRYENEEIDDVARANNELQGSLKTYLFNDRVAVYGGVNIDLDNEASPGIDGGAFYAGDFAIEYFLTSDKQFKIRFYQSVQPDIAGGRRNQTGVGVNYRKEFNSFKEFLQGMKTSTKQIKKDDKG